MKLSVLAPLYNEEDLVGALLEKVIAAPLPSGMTLEIIVADDGSTDSSVEEVEAVAASIPEPSGCFAPSAIKARAPPCGGPSRKRKGTSPLSRTPTSNTTPRSTLAYWRPLLDGRADAVYGSRFMVAGERRVLYFWHSLANQILTGICNIFADLNLTDMETCYKAFRTPLSEEHSHPQPTLRVRAGDHHQAGQAPGARL